MGFLAILDCCVPRKSTCTRVYTKYRGNFIFFHFTLKEVHRHTHIRSHQTKQTMSEQTTATDGESFSAIYKKKNGTLILTDTHLSFNSAPSPSTNSEQKPLLIQ